MASSSSIGGLAIGLGTLCALGVGVESLAGPPTSWNKVIWQLNLVILPVESGYKVVESGYIAVRVWLYGG